MPLLNRDALRLVGAQRFHRQTLTIRSAYQNHKPPCTLLGSFIKI